MDEILFSRGQSDFGHQILFRKLDVGGKLGVFQEFYRYGIHTPTHGCCQHGGIKLNIRPSDCLFLKEKGSTF